MTDILSDVINGCVAIGTVAMAIYTRRMVQAAKNSIDDTNKALEAANRTARATERMLNE